MHVHANICMCFCFSRGCMYTYVVFSDAAAGAHNCGDLQIVKIQVDNSRSPLHSIIKGFETIWLYISPVLVGKFS